MLIEFTKDFANRKKGDIADLDGVLCSVLINDKKVAKPRKRKTKKEEE